MKNITLIVIAATILFAGPSAAFAKDTWYSTEEQDRINQQLSQLQSQIGQLQLLNAQLEAKIGAIKPVQQVVQATPAPATPATDPQTLQRVTTLETKVSKLEQAMSFLQDTLLTAVNKTISLLTKLLAK